MNFLEFPKDIRVMLIKYLYPQEAFFMFRMCKKINQLIKEFKLQDSILKKFLNWKTTKEFEEDVRQLNLCTQCNFVFPKHMKEHAIQIHYRKHEQGKRMQHSSYYHLTKTTCFGCGCPISNHTSHLCISEQINCYTGNVGDIFLWAETLCEKIDWFKLDPKYKTHKCKARCKCCGEEFSPTEVIDGCYYGYKIHYQKCKEREKIDEMNKN